MADEKRSENYAEPYEYEADMLRSSKLEQDRRRSAASEKDPKLRSWYERRAEEAHAEMTDQARFGLEARRARRRPQKRK